MSIPQKRRRLGAIALVATAALAAGACSSGSGSDASDGGKVTLNYWTWFPAEATLKKSIEAFEAKNPGITINLKEYEAADYQKQLPLALNGGQSLDIVGVQVSAMTNTNASQLLPVDKWPGLPKDWESNINPTMLGQTKDIAKDKTLYSIPMGSIGSPIVYSNETLLKKAGVSGVPKTAAEWGTAISKIKAAVPDALPVAFTGDAWFQHEMFFGVAGQLDPKLSDKLYAGEVKWNDPKVVTALNAYAKLYADGVLDRKTLSLKTGTAGTQFNAGKAAYLIDGSWSSSVLSAAYRTENKIAIEDAGAGPLPVAVEGGTPAVRTFAEGGLGIPKASKHAEEASKFIQFMTFGEGVSTWAGDLVVAPSLVGYTVPSTVLTSPAAQQGYAEVQKLLGADGSGRDSVVTNFTAQVLDNKLLDLARGSVAAQKVADDLQAEWASGRYPVS